MAHLDLQRGTYHAAATLLGSRDSRTIGHNTRLVRRADGYAVRYHSTDIVTLSADGWLTVNTGGWYTVTTWTRINALLPAPWGIHSHRGIPTLYASGRPVTPYVDGLRVHPDNGSVGFGDAVILTADDVTAVIAAADVAAAARADKRAARLLREHPTVGGPRTHTRSLYDRRSYDCARCTAELQAEREATAARLSAEHAAWKAAEPLHPADPAHWPESDLAAAGSHVSRETVRTYPPLPGDTTGYRRDYSAEPDVSERVKIECPWGCPDRPRSW